MVEVQPMSNPPFGRPGISPGWANARKQAVGTALSDHSCIWFTVSNGVPEYSHT